LNIVTQMEAGGAQKAALQICEKLIELGYRSEVWFIYKKRPIYEGYACVRCVADRRPKSFWEICQILGRLWNWIYKTKPVGVITYTHYANIIGQFIAWAARIPYRLTTQHSPSWSYPLVARFFDAIWGSLKIYTANIYASESVRISFDSYPASYRARSCVVVNGLLKPQPSCANKQEARQKLGLPKKALIIVNIGRLALEKNQGMLIKAIAKIPRSDIILAIAGAGELCSQLYSLIAKNGVVDRVFLLGELPPPQVYDLLIAGDIFAFPSRYESFGFALVEAMMLGLPVLVSDIDAHREVVGDAGIFLPVDDVEAWAQAMVSLAENPLLRMEIAARAQARAEAYDLDRMVDGYLRALFGENPDALQTARRRG